MLRVGIVGCGCIFTMHATSCDHLENAQLVGVCDIKKDRADAAAKRYNVKAYYDYKELIKPELIDVVHICVPHYLHPIISKYALENGVNVLCEKPAARIYSEALEMQKVQHETGKVLNIGVCNRFHNGVRVLKKLIDDGMFGDIFHVYVSFRAFRSIPGLGGAFTTKDIADAMAQGDELAKEIFDTVIVVTDRINLDKQIKDTIKQFMQVANTVAWAEHSGDLRKAIQDGKRIIITTIVKSQSPTLITFSLSFT